MNQLLKHIILLACLVQYYPAGISAHLPATPEVYEKVIMFTDRSLYIAGEDIYFSGTVFMMNQHPDTGLSKVLYVELINNTGLPVIAQKFRISRSTCTGLVQIPENVTSGIYYIKAYTRYMRNEGPGSFSYNLLKVINPTETNAPAFNRASGHGNNDDIRIGGIEDQQVFDIKTDGAVYGQRDSVQVRFRASVPVDSLRSACLSVVPANSGIDKRILINGNLRSRAPGIYKPESNGITLSGMVVNKDTGIPLPAKQVDLSLLVGYCDLISVFTDPEGRFYISLPDITGKCDIFIGADNTDSVVPAILVDNDFSPYSIILPNEAFILSDVERETALNLTRNYQVSSVFTPEKIRLTVEPTGKFNAPFYGKPASTLNLDDYVQLPVLEDYFNELSFPAKVRKVNGKKYFRIQGPNPEINLYKPLVLVDGIAVYEHGQVLSLPSNNISHVDIINEPYIKGNLIYGGIVSIFSKNKDFALMNLPPSGLFISYDFLSEPAPVLARTVPENIPDARNTLYWNGNLQVPDEPENSITFITGNSKGEYDIIVRGVLSDGTDFSQTVSFLVE